MFVHYAWRELQHLSRDLPHRLPISNQVHNQPISSLYDPLFEQRHGYFTVLSAALPHDWQR
jgi:hypothetical protein